MYLNIIFCQILFIYLRIWSHGFSYIVNKGTYINLFLNIQSVLCSQNKANLIIMYYFYIYCWICFGNILLRISTPLCMKGIKLYFFFTCSTLMWFWYQSYMSLIKWVGKCSLFFFLEELSRISLFLLQVFGRIAIETKLPGDFKQQINFNNYCRTNQVIYFIFGKF